MNSILKPSHIFFSTVILMILLWSSSTGAVKVVGLTFDVTKHPGDTISLADPTIFHHQGMYYLYGTGGEDGFLVYSSMDMVNWKGPVGVNGGYALKRGDSFGSKGFWAPQVFYRNHTFYMAYTADEQIAIAESKSPLGPFKQKIIRPISGEGKQIDPFVFFDDGGKVFLYHVRLSQGNRMFVAEMKPDLSDIKAETVKECISATEPWENTAKSDWPVAEGPTVLKRNDIYYLFYSANDFRNIDYAVGYAVATTPYGPWMKMKANPIIDRNLLGKNGTGHGDFVQNEKGDWWYVLHTHRSNHQVSPRLTAKVRVDFIEGESGVEEVEADAKTFHFLRVSEE